MHGAFGEFARKPLKIPETDFLGIFVRMNFRALAIIVLLFYLTGCRSGGADKYASTMHYARCFRLEKKAGYQLLSLINPETGSVEKQYALVKKRGAQIPASCERIDVPVRRVIALSATHIGMITALGERNSIVGTPDSRYLADRVLLHKISARGVKAFGDESSAPVSAIVDTKAQLVIYSGFGNAFPNEEKLRMLGIISLADYDWREADPLGRAEWIKVFGALYDKDEAAEKLSREIEANYKKVKAELSNKLQHSKVVSGSLFGGVWYAPAGESYMAHLFKDAGLDYVYATTKGTGSCERSFGQVLKETSGVEVWVNPGVASRKELLKQNSRYRFLYPYKKGKIYCYTLNANFFWEQSGLHPDRMLSDLASIGGNLSSPRLYYYSQLK